MARAHITARPPERIAYATEEYAGVQNIAATPYEELSEVQKERVLHGGCWQSLFEAAKNTQPPNVGLIEAIHARLTEKLSILGVKLDIDGHYERLRITEIQRKTTAYLASIVQIDQNGAQ